MLWALLGSTALWMFLVTDTDLLSIIDGFPTFGEERPFWRRLSGNTHPRATARSKADVSAATRADYCSWVHDSCLGRLSRKGRPVTPSLTRNAGRGRRACFQAAACKWVPTQLPLQIGVIFPEQSDHLIRNAWPKQMQPARRIRGTFGEWTRVLVP